VSQAGGEANPLTKADTFLALHVPGKPLLLPNPWDIGSALVLEQLGFRALATTSSGFAATLGRPDGSVSRDEAVGHAGAIALASGVPVSADLENGFADDPGGVAETVRAAVAAGLAGCSIEDATGNDDDPVYPPELAAERIAAAVEAASGRLVLTARAENYLYGRTDLADTIARLQAYQQAGADVLYAPGLTAPGDIRSVVESVDRPVNVLAVPTAPPVAELAQLGVARISVGGAFLYTAFGALVEAGRELLEQGSYGFAARAKIGRVTAREAFETNFGADS
jgi:2-methylisocitrate lyase-like PEP mutase family enzyme